MKSVSMNLILAAVASCAMYVAADATQDCTMTYRSGESPGCSFAQSCLVTIDGNTLDICGDSAQGSYNSAGNRLTVDVANDDNPQQTVEFVLSGSGGGRVDMKATLTDGGQHECNFVLDITRGSCLNSASAGGATVQAAALVIAASAAAVLSSMLL